MKMRTLANIFLLTAVGTLPLTSCVETATDTAGGQAEGAAVSSGNSTTAAPPREKLTKHDAALRFLTAFIRLDRNMALQYATPEAVNKLNWNTPHGGNIPYYDDKMILYYRGGLAKVYFQEDAYGSYRVSKLHVY